MTTEIAVVPCGRCTACCRNELIPLMPDDDPNAYDTKLINGIRVLNHRLDGSCVYLGKRGCTIHARAPAVCKSFDCRKFVLRFNAGRYGDQTPDPEVMAAGVARLATLKESPK